MDDVTRLAVAAAAGDRIALHGFVRMTQPDVWRLCAHLTSSDRAEDLVQETYLRAMRALPSFRGDASARTWLLSIARHTVYDSYRSGRRLRLLDQTLRSKSALADPGEPDPGGEVSVRLAIAALGPDRRAAFVLTQLLGLSYEETAEICECPVGTIRSRIARARQDLINAVDQRPSAVD